MFRYEKCLAEGVGWCHLSAIELIMWFRRSLVLSRTSLIAVEGNTDYRMKKIAIWHKGLLEV